MEQGMPNTKTCHVKIRFSQFQEILKQRNIKISHVPSKDNIANVFTKALPFDAFNSCCQKLQLHSNFSQGENC
ncbi:hypothetical protein HMI54_013055 [Coelomomyces lativittatus]|nr:hypothetical protein HMI54_013055 [Coelomomyces lativittatus]